MFEELFSAPYSKGGNCMEDFYGCIGNCIWSREGRRRGRVGGPAGIFALNSLRQGERFAREEDEEGPRDVTSQTRRCWKGNFHNEITLGVGSMSLCRICFY